MAEVNHAEKLAAEIMASLPEMKWDGGRVESRLQPTFDLLKRIHQLVDENGSGDLNKQNILEEIEALTREYDNKAEEEK